MKRLIGLGTVLTLVTLSSIFWACTSIKTIQICKQTSPPGGTGFPFSWTTPAGGQPPFTLNDGQCSVKLIGNQVVNSFTESVPSGWALTNISCNYTTSGVKIVGANPNPAFQPGDNTVTIDLNEPKVRCTFVDSQLPVCCAYSVDLSTGQGNAATDPSWTVNNGSAYITPPVAPWTVSMPPARWIQPVAAPTPASNIPASPPIYKYTISFNVPPCAMGHVELNGTFGADDYATALLDGSAIAGATCTNCFNSAPALLNVPSVTPAGTHVLEIDVGNLGAYSGLIVNAQVRRICP